MSEAREVPLRVRVVLAHAAVQHLADAHGVDLLHIKGPAVAPGLRGGRGTGGTDADVIVRPAHVPVLLDALAAHGWRTETTFATGSAFDHAANLFHEHWGLLDVHRLYPGMEADPAAAFDVLWDRRGSTELARVRCAVPDVLAQSLVLLLHAARTPVPGEHPDIAPNWTDRTPTERAALRELAERTGATVGLAAATGDLATHAGRPEAAVWEVFAGGRSDRLAEWSARWRAARGPRAKASVALRSVLVNRYYLRQRLGHDPSRREMATEFLRRGGAGLSALVRRGRQR